MNVLIVHAHPEPRSFNSAMKDLAVTTLREAGHQVLVSDLYSMQFKPAASRDDFLDPADPDYLVYALEQRHAVKHDTLAPDIATELDKLKWADLLIFNFPLYWFGLPAMLKGWVDRVFVSGYCYGGMRIYDHGGLRGKKAMLAFSLGGREHLFGADAIHGEMETLLRPIQQGMFAYVGMTVLPHFAAYHVPYISTEARQQILQDYRTHLLTLDQRPPLRFASLDDFDERLRPKTPAGR